MQLKSDKRNMYLFILQKEGSALKTLNTIVPTFIYNAIVKIHLVDGLIFFL